MLTQSRNTVVRPALERGHTDQGWLNSYHTFSFADYYDPNHMGFSTLRVINEDRIQGGTGFGAHSHNDMEIVSYVVSGGLEHADSLGNKAVILPDEVQIMSAGAGITHAERNFFKDLETHFFQIWILPEKKGMRQSYGQKSFKNEFSEQDLVLVVSRDKRNGSIGINQDADIYIGRLKFREEINFNIRPERHIWIQMIKGVSEINKINLKAGDGLSISKEKRAIILAMEDSEFILFDLK
ncbi:MAG: pirin family protein [Candidatus Omnitrophica bacterium]|nr:pirin family protein [Candidatus Omnitrophota bacterium]